MAITSLSSAQLQRLIELVKEKKVILAKLAEVERSLDNLDSGAVTNGKPLPKKRGPRRARRRMALKDPLLNKLQEAGKQGMTVKELVVSLKANPASVSVWFYTTGKKVKGLRKIGKGRYAYLPE